MGKAERNHAVMRERILQEKNEILIGRLGEYKDRCHQLEARKKWRPADKDDEAEPTIPVLSLMVSSPTSMSFELDAIKQSNVDKDEQMKRKDGRIRALEQELATLRGEHRQSMVVHTQATDSIEEMKREMLELTDKCLLLERQRGDIDQLFDDRVYMTRSPTKRLVLSTKQSLNDSGHSSASNLGTYISRHEHSKTNLSILSYQDFMMGAIQESVTAKPSEVESPLSLQMSLTNEALLSDIDDKPCFVDKSTSLSDDDGTMYIDYDEYRVEVDSPELPSLPRETLSRSGLSRLKKTKSIAKLENLKSVTKHIGKWEQIERGNTPRPMSGKTRKQGKGKKKSKNKKRRAKRAAGIETFPDFNIRLAGE